MAIQTKIKEWKMKNENKTKNEKVENCNPKIDKGKMKTKTKLKLEKVEMVIQTKM